MGLWYTLAFLGPFHAPHSLLREPRPFDPLSVNCRGLRVAVRQMRHDLVDGAAGLGDLFCTPFADAMLRAVRLAIRADQPGLYDPLAYAVVERT